MSGPFIGVGFAGLLAQGVVERLALGFGALVGRSLRSDPRGLVGAAALVGLL
jgi:hypothetical protein